MALERPPKYLQLNPEGVKSYRPPESEVKAWHTVGTSGKESWLTIEKAYGVPAERIIGFNFPGAVESGRVVPEIVNWYLRFHKDFNCPETVDRKNRRFKGGERVAIPFLGSVEIGEPVIVERLKPREATGLWVGGGYKGGTTFGVVGIETSQMVCMSLDDLSKGFTSTISGSRFPALGIGASGGPFGVIVSSMKRPHELSRVLSGDHSYSLTLGARLKGLLGDARVGRAGKALSDFASKYGRMGRAAAKYGPTLGKYHSELVDVAKVLGMDFKASEPQVVTIDIPVGGFGVEIGYQFVVSEYHVLATW